MRNLVRSAGFGALSTGFSPTGVDIHTEDRRTAGPRLARSCLSHHSPLCPEAKSRRLIPERRIIGTYGGLEGFKTRLWLGGEVSEQRDLPLIRRLIARVRRGAACRPLLVCTDGLVSYTRAIRETFRDPVQTGQGGRPRLRPWRHVLIAQVVKRYERRRVVDTQRRIVEGTPARVETLRRRSQGGGVINTAYIERLNATFRERLAPLARRCRALARHTMTLHEGMFVVGTVYNFCTPHESLSQTQQTTPAMAAGITDHGWTMHELLSFHVPLSRWGTTEAAWTSFSDSATPDRAMVRVTTVNCRATKNSIIGLYRTFYASIGNCCRESICTFCETELEKEGNSQTTPCISWPARPVVRRLLPMTSCTSPHVGARGVTSGK
jgi:hypothetical protein